MSGILASCSLSRDAMLGPIGVPGQCLTAGDVVALNGGTAAWCLNANDTWLGWTDPERGEACRARADIA
jgi:hypothetical protein